MKVKNYISLMLACFVLMSYVIVGTAKAPVYYTPETLQAKADRMSFQDTAGHWAEKAIQRFAAAGILCGDENHNFCPEDFITNAEFAIVLSRLFGYKSQSKATVTDLTEDWYKEAVMKVIEAGVMCCDDEGKFYPYHAVSREEAVMYIALAFGIAPIATKNINLSYNDKNQIASRNVGYVAAMTNANYIHGDENNNFAPQNSLTRAECVTILNNMVSGLFCEEAIYDYTSYKGIADYVIVRADNVTVYNFDIGKNIILAENVDHTTVFFKGCVHFGKVMQYKSGKYTTLSKPSYNLYATTKLTQTPYSTSKYLLVNDIMYYSDRSVKSYIGVDVSSHNGKVDWEGLKNSGVYFAMIRCGNRGYGTGKIMADEMFLQNVREAVRAGMKVGVYFFSQAVNTAEAVEEAEFVLEKIKGLNISFPVVFDWEAIPTQSLARSNTVSAATVCANAKIFCDTVREAGYTPMIYANNNDISKYYTDSFLANYELWYCQFSKTPAYSYKYSMWQYGTFPNEFSIGNGEIDMNISFVDYSKIKP